MLDAVLEVKAPFDPEIAVSECTAVLRRFGVTRVIGDRYAGEWPKARFAEHGISFEQSARPKSDLYHDLLPLLNARRVELLEHPRLSAQLVGLERRTARSGKDSIDHSPGGHDDIANACAGVLVGLDLDRRPGLVRQNDLLSCGVALPVPKHCKYIVATMAVDKFWQCAVVYCATSFTATELMVIDFDAEPMHGSLFAKVGNRVRELSDQCRSRGSIVFVPELLLQHARSAGLICELAPPDIEPEELLLSASNHSSAGRVKLCTPAFEKSRQAPFTGALDFRASENADDPLRAAALLVIALCLDVPQ